MAILFANNFSTTIVGNFNDSATSLVMTTAAGWPTMSGGDVVYAVLFQVNTGVDYNVEVIKVTAIDVPSKTITVVRGQDNTTAINYSTGTVYIEIRPVAADMDEMLQSGANLSDVASAQTARNNILPSQTSNSGKYLKTDGTNVSWVDPNASPTQTGTITNTAGVYATGSSLKTNTGAGDTLLLQAYDVDGASYTTFGTLTANNTPTFTLSSPTISTILNTGTLTLPTTTGTLATTGNVAQTFQGDVTISGAATLNGNVVVGDADTDTVTVGGAFVSGTQLKSAKSAGNTLKLSAYDVDGTVYTDMITLTANNTPTIAITDPSLGNATATTLNKVTITQPATGSTLTIADGKTLTANNSLTLAGTDSTTMTFPTTSQTVAGLATAQTFTAKQTVDVTDAANASVTQVARVSHQTSGTPGTGIGVGLEFAAETAAGNVEVGATLEAITTDVTSASEDFDLVVKTMKSGAAATEAGRFKTSAFSVPTGFTYQINNSDVLGSITAVSTTGSIELGHASDTTISRSSAGVIAVEGVTVPLNSVTNTHTAQQIELGHATDTTITRVSAGVIAVEGVNVVMTGGALGTPSSGTLSNCTGLPVSGITASTSTALGVGSIELGHASDTTISRSSAGVIAVEGVTVPLNSVTNTHTAQQIELGHATDTTLSRGAAGVLSIEGKYAVTSPGAYAVTLTGPTVARTYTLPDEDTTVVGTAAAQTLTNKTLAALTNNVEARSGAAYTAFTYRNKVIGGNFSTNPWQRGTTFTAAATGAYCADKFRFVNTSAAVVDILKTADAPTAALAGVYSTHCLHVDVTTADASIAAGDVAVIDHLIEGLNIASAGFGQSGTRYVTLWFAHKHTVTGTYCVGFQNAAANRSYVATYTQDVADTWEIASVMVPVDTSGTWLYDTGTGLMLRWCLAAGSTFQTTAGAWAAGNFVATSAQVNALSSTANNFKIQLIQLELGHTPSPFEDRGPVLERSLCQRYYYRHFPAATATPLTVAGWSYTSTLFLATNQFPVTMRAAPTALEQSGTANQYAVLHGGVVTVCSSVPTFHSATTDMAMTQFNVASGMTSGQGGVGRTDVTNGASAYIGWSADLA